MKLHEIIFTVFALAVIGSLMLFGDAALEVIGGPVLLVLMFLLAVEVIKERR